MAALAAPRRPIDLRALTGLAAADPQVAELVKLRYFAGLTIPQAAEALGISTSTADRSWAYARAWLHAALKHDGTSGIPD